MDDASLKVFVVASGKLVACEGPISLADAGFKERSDLQEWVIANPSILGDDLKIVTFELGQWVSGVGEGAKDRLDVLALDRDGYLLVAELKRGTAPDSAEMQMVKYAALSSNFSLDLLAEKHADFMGMREHREVDSDEALEALVTFAPDVSDETLEVPRMALVAEDFKSTTLNTILFLRSFDLDIRVVRFRLHRTPDGSLIFSSNQLIPTVSEDEYRIGPTSKERRQRDQDRRKEATSVTRLLAAKALEDGAQLRFQAATSGPKVDQLNEWVAAEPTRGHATWQNTTKPLIWEVDGKAYSPTGLIKHMFQLALDWKPDSTRGPQWWVTADGINLAALANSKGTSQVGD